MVLFDTIETGLTLFQRLWEVWQYLVAVLIGFFMILWGIFFNGGDWLLIGAGGVTCLAAGWYVWQGLAAPVSS